MDASDDMLNSEQNVQECDATKADSSAEAGLTKSLIILIPIAHGRHIGYSFKNIPEGLGI